MFSQQFWSEALKDGSNIERGVNKRNKLLTPSSSSHLHNIVVAPCASGAQAPNISIKSHQHPQGQVHLVRTLTRLHRCRPRNTFRGQGHQTMRSLNSPTSRLMCNKVRIDHQPRRYECCCRWLISIPSYWSGRKPSGETCTGDTPLTRTVRARNQVKVELMIAVDDESRGVQRMAKGKRQQWRDLAGETRLLCMKPSEPYGKLLASRQILPVLCLAVARHNPLWFLRCLTKRIGFATGQQRYAKVGARA